MDRMATDHALKPAKGDRYVWGGAIGEVFMEVANVLIGGRNPRVVFACRQPNGAFWKKTMPYPFTSRIERREWTDDEIAGGPQ
jgi:hypothetical protein